MQQPNGNHSYSEDRQHVSEALELLMLQQEQLQQQLDAQMCRTNNEALMMQQQYAAQQQLSMQNAQKQQQQQMFSDFSMAGGYNTAILGASGLSAPRLASTSPSSTGSEYTSIPSLNVLRSASQRLESYSNDLNASLFQEQRQQQEMHLAQHHQTLEQMDPLNTPTAQSLVTVLQNTKPLHNQRQECIDDNVLKAPPPLPIQENILMQGATTTLSPPQQKNDPSMYLLHQACRLYASTPSVIECALRADPASAFRRQPCPKNARGNPSKYVYPINIALSNKASFEVLHLLAHAAPETLLEPDGPDACSTVALALSELDDTNALLAVLNLFSKVNPRYASTRDAKKNFPLHNACCKVLPVQVVQKIVESWPQALHARNFHGQAPLDIAQRSGNILQSSDEVVNYLQKACFDKLEESACHLD